MNRNYIEEGETNLREREEMKGSSREIFTGLIDILRANGTSGYLLEFPLIRKALIVDNTASGDQRKISVKIWSRKDLDKTNKVHMTIEGAGYFEIVRKTRGTGESIVVYKQGKKQGKRTVNEPFSGNPYQVPQLYPLDIDGIRKFQATVTQIKAEIKPSSQGPLIKPRY